MGPKGPFSVEQGLIFMGIKIKMRFVVFTDKKLFKTIDYGFIATCVCFFIFMGNISRIDSVRCMVMKYLGVFTAINLVILISLFLIFK